MELLFILEKVLWIAAVFAEALLAVRFFREGLIRKFPFFVAFLTADAVCSIALMMNYDLKSRGYAEVYRICTLIMTVLRMGVAAELYERICEHFPGIGRFRAGMAAILVLLAALVSTFTFRPNLVNQWAFPQTIVVVILRFQSEIFAAAFALTWVFLRYVLSIRQPFRPNVLNHWRIATIYFGASGVAYLAILLSGGGTAVFPINCAMLGIQLGCAIAWFRLIGGSGEQLPAFERLSPDQVLSVERYTLDLLRTAKSLPGEISARQ